MVFLMDSCTQMAFMSGAYLLKTVKVCWEDDCQFSKRLMIEVGSTGMGAAVLTTQTHWVVYSIHYLSPSTMVGMATHLGLGDKHPLLVDILLMRSA